MCGLPSIRAGGVVRYPSGRMNEMFVWAKVEVKGLIERAERYPEGVGMFQYRRRKRK